MRFIRPLQEKYTDLSITFDRRVWMVPIRQIRLLNRIRFGVLAGIVVIFLMSLPGLGWTLSTRIATALIVTALFIHVAFEGIYRLAAHGRLPHIWAIRLSHLQILLDLVLILLAIHLTGGPYSPLDILLSAFLVGVAMAYSPRFAVATLLLTLLVHGSMMYAYWAGWLPLTSIRTLPSSSPSWFELLYLNGIDWVVFCAATFITLLLNSRLQQAYQDTAWERSLLAHVRQLVHRSLNQERLEAMVQGLVQDLAALSGIPRVYLTVWDESRRTVIAMAAHEGRRTAHAPQEISPWDLRLLTQACARCTAQAPLSPQDLPLHVVSRAWPFPSGSDVRFYPLRTARKGSYLGLVIFLTPEPSPLFRNPLWQAHMRDAMDVIGLILSRGLSEAHLAEDRALLEHLSRLSVRLIANLDQQQLAELAVEGGRELLSADRGALYVLDPREQRLHIWYAQGLSDDYINFVMRTYASLPGIQAITTQDLFVVTNTEDLASHDAQFMRYIRREGFRAYVVLPLSTFQGPVGGLILYWDKPRTFRQEELVVLRLWASHVASALANALLFKHLRDEAETDPMTHTLNRRPLAQRMVQVLQQAKQTQRPLVVLMIDVDNFKHINDTYGHAVGDAVLRHVAAVLMQTAEKYHGFVARYGGDEFVLVLPDLPPEGVERVIHEIYQDLYQTPAPEVPESLPMQLSIGYAHYPTDGDTPDTLLKVADQRLYQVKRQRKQRASSPDPDAETAPLTPLEEA